MRESGYHRLAIQGLEFIELGAVHNTRYHLARIIGMHGIAGHDAGQLGSVI